MVIDYDFRMSVSPHVCVAQHVFLFLFCGMFRHGFIGILEVEGHKNILGIQLSYEMILSPLTFEVQVRRLQTGGNVRNLNRR